MPHVPDADWATIVEHVPLVSVDLLVRQAGGLVLGKRTNDPAQGEWFVPGGTVLKNESLTDTVDRVAREELDTTVTIESHCGTFEHFYETSDVAGVPTKHYVAQAYVVTPDAPVSAADDQHTDLRVAHPPLDDPHPYVQEYVEALDWD
ncbi:NUDIX domain-containing protein [Halococcoides cellulosivorans]|uniref:NUDIX hydrolase n=1 Tax=Halococcoides cellulosivorans TaxID=1679096 RepID=A0A2R4X010_9EURY|nr:NUDIX domain-containing protein [Halococcoides cellulosivorans]AWB27130.1 NUDIX hydrolase [Halococcoides cellulosivorans]